MKGPKSSSGTEIIASPREFFSQAVREAIHERNLQLFPHAENYLVEILESFIKIERLYSETDASGRRTQDTLAEMFLRATNASSTHRVQLLKQLGETSLYVSGFFGDSLQRKLVDCDYYKNMGSMAYFNLAKSVREATYIKLYKEFSARFVTFADILTLISQRYLRTENSDNLLALFEKYIKTGSELAKDTLSEKGILSVSSSDDPYSNEH